VRLGVEGNNKVVQGSARRIEGPFGEALSPSLFELCDGGSGGVEYGTPLLCRKEEFCATVGRVGTPGEVTELLELVDELGACGQAELGLSGEVCEPNAIDADVAPHLQLREAQIEESPVSLRGGEEFGAELVEQAAEELTDRESVMGQGS
jgi:hypothetical protein